MNTLLYTYGGNANLIEMQGVYGLFNWEYVTDKLPLKINDKFLS